VDVTNWFYQRSAPAEFFVDPVESAVDMLNWGGDAVCDICALKHAMDVHDSLGFGFDQALTAKLSGRLHGNAPSSITVSVIWTLGRLVEMTCIGGRGDAPRTDSWNIKVNQRLTSDDIFPCGLGCRHVLVDAMKGDACRDEAQDEPPPQTASHAGGVVERIG
jgi:hypothetical protein